MILDDLRVARNATSTRVSVRVRWEQAKREPLELYAESDVAIEGAPRYDGFLTLCLLPAMMQGEQRVRVEGAVCPVLVRNLRAALGCFRLWYGRKGARIAIEAADEQSIAPTERAVAGMCYSGGIDSLATLRKNRLVYDREHPHRIRKGYFVYGFDVGKFGRQKDLDLFKLALEHGQTVAKEAGFELHPIYSNGIQLLKDGRFWRYYWHAAAYVGLVQVFGMEIRRLYLASSYEASNLIPWGSHPMLDPLYGTSYMDVVHDGIEMTRLEKTTMLADWEPALRHMRVCPKDPGNGINCGRCDKCVRTMLALLAVGKLKEATAFPDDDLTPDMIRAIKVNAPDWVQYYREVSLLLDSVGRQDLVRPVTAGLRKYPAHALRNKVLQFDQRVFAGSIRKMARTSLKRSGPRASEI